MLPNNSSSGDYGSGAGDTAAAPAAQQSFGPTIINVPRNLGDMVTTTAAAAADAGSQYQARDANATEMTDFGSGRPRMAKATDIVVVEPGAADGGREAPRDEESDADDQQPLAAESRGRPRTMGEVYPIMKNSIYEDEECSEEVTLVALDCGARFIRYVNGLFQYLVRNPKTMGLLFTTAIILLFFKYSQQVVVRSVNAALDTHPGLEPSDTLRSGVLAFTTAMRSFESVARTLEWAYLRDNIVGYDLATASGSTFLALAASLQQSFSANMQTYVAYQIPADKSATGKMQWGQIGCLDASGHLDGDLLCFHVAANGTAVGFRGSNTSDVVFTIPDSYADSRMTALADLTAITPGSPEAASGVWSRPLVVTEPFYDTTYRIIGFLLPIAFDTTANTFVGVDISVQHMAAAVSVDTANIDVIVADSQFMSEQGGQFVLDTFDPTLYWSEVHSVTETPSERVNEIARPILRQHRNSVMVNASFYEDGLIYQSLTMMDRWALLASSPMVLSAAEVEAAFRALLDEYEQVTSSASQAFTECQASATAQSDNIFIEAVGRFEETFGSRIHSLYVAYALEEAVPPSPSPSSSSSASSSSSLDHSRDSSSNDGSGSTNHSDNTDTQDSSNTHSFSSSLAASSSSSTNEGTEEDSSHYSAMQSASSRGETDSDSINSQLSSGSAERETASQSDRSLLSRWHAMRAAVASSDSSGNSAWGSCGCTYGSNDTKAYKCFYTDGDGVETFFNGAVRSKATEVDTLDFFTSRRHSFIQEQILTANTTSGFWTRPYNSYDMLTQETINAMSYVLPFRFSENGTVTAAAVFDLTMNWIPDFIREYTHAGTKGVVLIDRRDEGTFMGSRNTPANQIYAAMDTPNHTLNDICKSVYKRAGNTFDRSISFHDGPHLVNYQLIEPYWGIVEQIPADVALDRFLPTPTVTGATDALRLIPTGKTIELFLYVGGILLCYFLNLLILGCSKLGAPGKPQPTASSADASAVNRSSAMSDASSSAASSPRASAWM